MSKKLISIGEAAKAVGVTPQTLRNYEADGVVIAQRVGRQRVYTPAQVDALKAYRARLCSTTTTIRERYAPAA